MKAFTKKQYEESLNKIGKVDILTFDKEYWLSCYHSEKAGTRYRKNYNKLFNLEYEKAVKDNDLIYMVTGKYPD